MVYVLAKGRTQQVWYNGNEMREKRKIILQLLIWYDSDPKWQFNIFHIIGLQRAKSKWAYVFNNKVLDINQELLHQAWVE